MYNFFILKQRKFRFRKINKAHKSHDRQVDICILLVVPVLHTRHRLKLNSHDLIKIWYFDTIILNMTAL